MGIIGNVINWIFGPRPKPAPVPSPDPGPAADAVVAAVNAIRLRFKLKPLAADPTLRGTASEWAASMAAAGVMRHGDFAGRMREAGIGAAGECIGEGYASADAAAAAWYEDPPHRRIIMNPQFATAGGAVARGQGGGLYWCLDVAS